MRQRQLRYLLHRAMTFVLLRIYYPCCFRVRSQVETFSCHSLDSVFVVCSIAFLAKNIRNLFAHEKHNEAQYKQLQKSIQNILFTVIVCVSHLMSIVVHHLVRDIFSFVNFG